MPDLSPATVTAATSLADALSELPNIGATPALIAQLSHATTPTLLTTARSTTIALLVAPLTAALKSPSTPSSSRALALRATLLLARCAAPSAMLPHWPSLVHAVLTTHRGASDSSSRTRATTVVAALFACAAPFASLPAEARAPVSRAVHTILPDLLRLAIPSSPPNVLNAALVALHAALLAAPRELRNHTPALVDLCFTLSTHTSASVRTQCAHLLPALALAHPPPSRPGLQSALLTRLAKALTDIRTFLEHFSTNTTTPPPPPPELLMLTGSELTVLFETLCVAVRQSFTTSVGPSSELPIGLLTRALTTALISPSIDAYATPPPRARLDVAGANLLAASLPSAAIDALCAILSIRDRGALLPLSADVSRALSRAFATDVTTASTTSQALLRVLAKAVTAFGVGALPPDVYTLLAATLQRNVRASQPAPSPPPQRDEPRARKKRRHNTQHPPPAATAALLAGRVSCAAQCARDAAAYAALVTTRTVLISRAPLTEEHRVAMVDLHNALADIFVETQIPSPELVDAVAAAALAGAPDPPFAIASPLLDVALNRLAALPASPHVLAASAALDAIVHPRGPPVSRPRPRVRVEAPVATPDMAGSITLPRKKAYADEGYGRRMQIIEETRLKGTNAEKSACADNDALIAEDSAEGKRPTSEEVTYIRNISSAENGRLSGKSPRQDDKTQGSAEVVEVINLEELEGTVEEEKTADAPGNETCVLAKSGSPEDSTLRKVLADVEMADPSAPSAENKDTTGPSVQKNENADVGKNPLNGETGHSIAKYLCEDIDVPDAQNVKPVMGGKGHAGKEKNLSKSGPVSGDRAIAEDDTDSDQIKDGAESDLEEEQDLIDSLVFEKSDDETAQAKSGGETEHETQLKGQANVLIPTAGAEGKNDVDARVSELGKDVHVAVAAEKMKGEGDMSIGTLGKGTEGATETLEEGTTSTTPEQIDKREQLK